MSDLSNVLIAVVSGVAIFVIGQLVVKFIIEPLHSYRELVGRIAYSLIYFANVTTAVQDYLIKQVEALEQLPEPRKSIAESRIRQSIQSNWDKADDAQKTLRQQASELMGSTNAIPLYDLWAFFRLLPRKKNILKASENLIGLSNEISSGRSSSREPEIAKALNIKILKQRYGK